MDLKLSGTRVLVTGGTRGIGRAVVEAFLAEGAHVAFCARNPDEVLNTQEALRLPGASAARHRPAPSASCPNGGTPQTNSPRFLLR